MALLLAFVRSNAMAAAGFTRLPSTFTGVEFQNALSPREAAANQVRMNGSGVAAGDIDGDGLADLFFASAQGANKLYRNRGGFHFEDITAESGLHFPKADFTGAALIDLDGDSDLDLLVGSIGAGLFLFENDGHGHFQDVTERSGLISKAGNMSFAIADFDGDGFLDIYVANYRTNTFRSVGLKLLNVNGKSMVMPEDQGSYELTPDGRILEYGEADFLFHNNGSNRFSLVPWTGGAFLNEKGQPLPAAPRDWGLSAMARDFNGDGLPDLYVCDDFFTPDRIWLNDGKGHLRAAPPEMLRVTSAFSMGVDVADFNRDGHDDIFVVDMLARSHRQRLAQGTMTSASDIAANRRSIRSQENHNTLFAARGDGTFAEISQFAGVEASDWSWCPVALDVDLDGLEDILITTGHMFDTQDLDAEANKAPPGLPGLLSRPELKTPNRAFRNLGNFKFEEHGKEWGFADIGISHGICLVDLDNDGDLDLVVNNLNEPAGIYRNDTAAPRVAVRLKGRSPNTRGIGAKISLYGGAVPIQSQSMIAGGRYLSSDDSMRTFAAGVSTNPMRIEVIWPGGRRSVVNSVKANTIQVVDEITAQPFEKTKPPNIAPLFEDMSQFIQHRHTEDEYDDFARQSTLPRKLSELGPGLTWGDLNGDGKEDLVVGASKGAELEIYFNAGEGRFSRFKTGPYIGKLPDDTGALLALPAGPNEGLLIAGQASYESGQTNAVVIYKLNRGIPTQIAALDLGASSVGPLAMADVDGDGDLDLFVGGRVVPGKFPEAAISRLFLKEPQGYRLAQEFSGMVSGAVFSDLDGDGIPEIVLACDCGPIRVFKRISGRYEEQKVGLEKFTGWWNGVTTGDFDGDGKMDIVASNWGRNTKYESLRKKGLRMHYGDWAKRGTAELLESYWDDESGQELPVRGLDVLRRAAPELAEKFATHAAYAKASVREILAGVEDHVLEITTLESMVFLNRGDHFEPIELPVEAQWAPCFGVSVADADGDAIEDIFLSQNFTALDDDTSRCVEGRGFLLRGIGNGTFKSMSAQESGIAVYGDGCGCAWCDFNGDGRIDLAVAQNRGPTRLFRNIGGTSGIRVRLRGPGENAVGAGAVVRMKRNGKFGPAHEVKIGSGYWSQESSVLVIARGEEIDVLWPGGKRTRAKVPAQATEMTIDYRQTGE